jgi:hypothetical protein
MEYLDVITATHRCETQPASEWDDIWHGKLHVPGSLESYFVRPPADIATLESRSDWPDALVRRQCVYMTGELLKYLRARWPTDREWEDGLPVFVCGGGREHPVFVEALDKNEALAMTVLRNVGRFRRMTLDRPRDLQPARLTEGEFQRLAVAYGLSIGRAFDLGNIEAVADIAPLPPPQSRRWLDSFIEQP